MANYLNLAEIDNAVNQNQMAGLQRDSLMQNLLRQKKMMADEDALNSVYNESVNPDGTIDETGLVTKLRGKGLGMKANEVYNTSAANKLAQQKATQEAESNKLKMMVDKAKYGRDVMASVTPETWGQTRQQLIEQGFEFAKNLPETYDPMAHKSSVMDANSFIKQQEVKAPTTRTIRMGNDQVTQEFDPKTGQFVEIGRGGAFAPDKPVVDNSAPVQIMGADGKPVFVNRKDAIGKQPYSAKQEAADAQKVNQTSQASISTQQVLDQAQLLFQHPGRALATGASSFMSAIPGTDAKGFQANLDTFKAQTFVPMVSALKGMGALSDAEGKKLSESVGALNPDMPEKEFEESLRTVTKTLFDKAKASGLNVSMPEFANTPTTKAQGAIAKVTNNADYAKLPKGAKYTDPNGNVRTKK
jgi:hypothetical protein